MGNIGFRHGTILSRNLDWVLDLVLDLDYIYAIQTVLVMLGLNRSYLCGGTY